jgi:hypothetical protein
MSLHIKRRLAFACSMGAVTTGIISFVLLVKSAGFSDGFALRWLSAWGTGYLLVIPAILLIGPRVQAQVDRWIR